MAEKDHLLHKPDVQGEEHCNQLRAKFIELEGLMDALCGQGRDLAVAKTQLEMARMWAIKAVVMQYPAVPLDETPVALEEEQAGVTPSLPAGGDEVIPSDATPPSTSPTDDGLGNGELSSTSPSPDEATSTSPPDSTPESTPEQGSSPDLGNGEGGSEQPNEPPPASTEQAPETTPSDLGSGDASTESDTKPDVASSFPQSGDGDVESDAAAGNETAPASATEPQNGGAESSNAQPADTSAEEVPDFTDGISEEDGK